MSDLKTNKEEFPFDVTPEKSVQPDNYFYVVIKNRTKKVMLAHVELYSFSFDLRTCTTHVNERRNNGRSMDVFLLDPESGRCKLRIYSCANPDPFGKNWFSCDNPGGYLTVTCFPDSDDHVKTENYEKTFPLVLNEETNKKHETVFLEFLKNQDRRERMKNILSNIKNTELPVETFVEAILLKYRSVIDHLSDKEIKRIGEKDGKNLVREMGERQPKKLSKRQNLKKNNTKCEAMTKSSLRNWEREEEQENITKNEINKIQNLPEPQIAQTTPEPESKIEEKKKKKCVIM